MQLRYLRLNTGIRRKYNMEDKIKHELVQLFKNFNKRPVAFIGSGISRRYLDTPDWKGLLKYTFEQYDGNLARFGQMIRENEPNGLEYIASKIEKEFDDYFINIVCTDENNPLYHLYKANMDDINNGRAYPYKIFLANYFSNVSTNKTFDQEKQSFKNFLSKCANVITTNYDHLIENNSDLQCIIGNKDFINDKCIGYGELYKIHGCCSRPNSIIITSRDYEDFNKKKSFYHAKLLLSFIEQPIIFLGYSLNDSYIESILNDISELLDDEDLHALSKRLIFIEYSNTSETTVVEKIIKKLHMTCIKTNEFAEIYKLISTNVQEGIPLELIRKFKEAVKNFVYEQNNPNALSVVGVEDIKDGKDLVAFHIGKAESISDRLSMVNTKDIILDILYDSLNGIDYDGLIELLTSGNEDSRFPKKAYIPLYKMLKKSTKYKNISIFHNRKIITSSLDLILNTKIKKCKTIEILIQKLNESYSSGKYNDCLTLLLANINIVDAKLLREFLLLVYERDGSFISKSEFRKLVCYLDLLENK